MGRKVSPSLFRIDYYPRYVTFYKTPFKFNNYIKKNKISLEILTYLKQLKNKILILDFKIVQITSNIIIVYIIIPDSKYNLNLSNDLIKKCTILNKNIFKKYSLNIYFELNCSTHLFKYTNYLIFYIKTSIKQHLSIRSIFKKLRLEILKRDYLNTLKLQGLKLKISGRINGAELAKIESFKQGKLPLQTITQDIKYTKQMIKTKFGILGIKLWIFYN